MELGSIDLVFRVWSRNVFYSIYKTSEKYTICYCVKNTVVEDFTANN